MSRTQAAADWSHLPPVVNCQKCRATFRWRPKCPSCSKPLPAPPEAEKRPPRIAQEASGRTEAGLDASEIAAGRGRATATGLAARGGKS